MLKYSIHQAGVVFRVWEKYFSPYIPFEWWLSVKDDWRQEAYTIALEYCQQEVSKAVLSKIQSAWYRFCKNYGLYKPKHSSFYKTRREEI